MSSPPPEDEKLREERRRKLIGRLAVIGLLLLALAYIIPLLFHPQLGPH